MIGNRLGRILAALTLGLALTFGLSWTDAHAAGMDVQTLEVLTDGFTCVLDDFEQLSDWAAERSDENEANSEQVYYTLHTLNRRISTLCSVDAHFECLTNSQWAEVTTNVNQQKNPLWDILRFFGLPTTGVSRYLVDQSTWQLQGPIESLGIVAVKAVDSIAITSRYFIILEDAQALQDTVDCFLDFIEEHGTAKAPRSHNIPGRGF